MSGWLLAATVLIGTLLPALIVISRRSFEDGLVAIAAASTVTVLAMTAIGVAIGRSPFLDAALLLSFLSFVGMLAAARFVERWL